jgi:hypothetical protein
MEALSGVASKRAINLLAENLDLPMHDAEMSSWLRDVLKTTAHQLRIEEQEWRLNHLKENAP